MKSTQTIKLSYIFLLIVMGGRTALFVSKLDAILPLDKALGIPVELTPLSVFLAVALIMAVPGAAMWRGQAERGSAIRRVATTAMISAAFLDGWLNVSEAVYLATQRGVFDEFTGFVQWWMWATVVMVGVGPTILTVLLAWLVGEQTKDAAHLADKGRKAVAYSPTMEAHLRTVCEQLTPNVRFRRTEIDKLMSCSKQQSNNIVRYGIGRGVFSENGERGSYIMRKGDEQ